MNDQILAALQNRAVDNQIACADAHEVAELLGVSPLEVSRVINRASSLRVNRCQLGLFGYGPKEEGKHKIVSLAAHVPEDIEMAIREKVINGRISCADIWEIAGRYKYPRLGIANIIEALEIKVKPCQLGCF